MIALANNGDGSPEVFSAIQGEGPMGGLPRVFVRLSGCNLTCRWCDTPYTWRWSDKAPHLDGVVYDPSVEVIKLSEDELALAIQEHQPYPLVFTGGEPLLQQKAVLRSLALLSDSGDRMIEFETNGTRAVDPVLAARASLFVVSPKLDNSGVRSAGAVDECFLRSRLAEKTCFKFVLSSTNDADTVDRWVAANRVRREQVWLMPEGRTVAELDSRLPWVAAHCVLKGYALSDRLHIRIAGDTRGT